MSPTQTRAFFRSASRVSPELAGSLALRAFFQTQPRLPLRETDAATDAAAERGLLRVRGKEIVTYRWGRGDDTVLLVHGWRGRASQFAPLVRELVAEGFHVVAFDAPAHGASTLARTDMRDWLAAIDALQQRHGRFSAIVGHSFGALAALTAVRSGTTSARVATVAGAGTPQIFVDQFGGMLGLSPRAKAVFERRFHAMFGEDEASFARRFDALANPLPPAVELLALHDDADLQVPSSASADLVAAHPDRALLVRTRGLGHNRILGADATLDAITAFVTGGLAQVVEAAAGSRD
ncbi:alpha/beta hydrolase [Microbacterium sp. 4R-513]|uniref:alpha/beta hydrolase n=1 Tax=Microbacterium sp. 4R-513 TaxID=2567934 RepID=UPI0013E1BEB0|nr:alpha/beta fold hydrolase [Microbacterium sp. 4R-513]QIG39054.1 alpha/beta hydrolase [Microbacterium sp. 4R-513]